MLLWRKFGLQEDGWTSWWASWVTQAPVWTFMLSLHYYIADFIQPSVAIHWLNSMRPNDNSCSIWGLQVYSCASYNESNPLSQLSPLPLHSRETCWKLIAKQQQWMYIHLNILLQVAPLNSSPVAANPTLTCIIRERGSVLYLGMATEILNLP